MRLRHISELGAAFLVASAPVLSKAQQIPADLPARIDAIFSRFDRSTPGCGVGLAKDAQTLYTHGYGMANLEYGVPNTDSTVFESGSVAKQFTASAILLLAQDGKLSLDDDIRKYLPEVPAFAGQRITIRNLLTHTSGLRDQWGLLGIEGRGPGTQVHSPMTTLDLVAHQHMLNFPPGSEYLYSNTGYALAGLIVQRVSGQSLEAFTDERLFRPLGMAHTQWRDDFTKVVKNRATAYSGSATTGFHTDMPFTNMIGNGGLLSTMADLMRWNENLEHPTVGGAAYTQAIQTPMRLTTGRTIAYALGLEVVNYNGEREVSHSGSTAGYQTFLARYPDQHVSVAVWCNSTGANPTTLAHQVVDLVFTEQGATSTGSAKSQIVSPSVATADMRRWAGTYRDPHTDQSITLVMSNDSLLATGGGRGGRGVSYLPLGNARFMTPQGEETFSGGAEHRQFLLARSSGDTTRFEEVKPPLTPPPTADYIGTYTSDELDVTFVVAARDGQLVLRRRPADEFELRPMYADDFQSGGGGLGTLRFARDAKGAVSGFSFYAGRVLDVRFTRTSRGQR